MDSSIGNQNNVDDETVFIRKNKRKCVIKGCSTYVGSGIPIHRFPREGDLLISWIGATKVNNVTLETTIYELHFKESDYFNLGGERRRLKKNAIPCLHLDPDDLMEHDHFCDDLSEEETDTTDEVASSDHRSSDHEDYDKTNDIETAMEIEDEADKTIVNSVLNEFMTSDNSKRVASVETQTESVDVTHKGVQTKRSKFIDLLKKDSDLQAFTGIHFSVLKTLEECIQLIQRKRSDEHLCTLQERIVLTICKLKLCLSYAYLGVMFQISKSTACNYFNGTIHLLHDVLEEAVYFPDKSEVKNNMPVHFKDFEDTRVVLDCTEVAVENSKCLQCRLKMYSHYKGRQTIKFLIGAAPSGLISYCSKCFGGRAPDKAIFQKSGLLQKCIPGEDAIMTDKGFLIEKECAESNIKFYRPPFASQVEQMSKEDSMKTKKIAAARVHIERVIERLKNYKILTSTIDWEMTRNFDKIIVIICGLVNIGRPIIDKTRFL